VRSASRGSFVSNSEHKAPRDAELARRSSAQPTRQALTCAEANPLRQWRELLPSVPGHAAPRTRADDLARSNAANALGFAVITPSTPMSSSRVQIARLSPSSLSHVCHA
jgi:hypothetical protein